jgi:hypothetical protein
MSMDLSRMQVAFASGGAAATWPLAARAQDRRQ